MPQTLLPTPLQHHEPRAACSEAERRLARDVARRLRDQGRRADVRTFWVHRGGPAVGALHAVAGLVASVVGVSHPIWGAAIAGVTLLSLLLDTGGRWRPLRRLWPARATQAVVSPPGRGAGAGAIDLLLVVRTDPPRRGVADRGRLGRSGVGPERLLAVGLLAVAALCGGRIAGADGPAVDIAQMAATVAILLAGAALADRAVAPRQERDAIAADLALATALEVVDALDREPARRLAPTLILCGAGAETLRPILREQRRAGVRAEDVAIVELGGSPDGELGWVSADGLVLPLRYHPALLRAAGQAASGTPVRRVRRAAGGPARAARGMRRPAVAIEVGTDDGPGAPAFVLALLRHLDTSLQRGT